MPRRRSSAHRSGSIPVSARTSVDLPWSTCPAVAMTCTVSRRRVDAAATAGWPARRRVAARRDAAQVDEAAAPLDAGDDAGLAAPQTLGVGLGERDGPAGRGSPALPRRRPAPRRGRPRRATRAASALGARARSRSRSAWRQSVTGGDRPAQGRLERGEGELVDAQRTGQGVAAQPLDRGGRRRGRSPAWGPPSSLSPLAVTTVAPSASAVAASGSSGSSGSGAQQPAADVDDERARPASRAPGRTRRS